MQKHDYSTEFQEKDAKIKFRRCKTCGHLHETKDMVTTFRCRFCDKEINKTKRCNRCHMKKPITDFYNDITCLDGHKTICKRCLKVKRNL